MPKRSSKDINQTAFSIMQQVTESPAKLSSALSDEEIRRGIMREMGRRGGLKGGKKRAASLSKARRREIAELAAAARWKKK